MQTLLAAARQILADVAQLEAAPQALAAAGVLAPLLAAVFGLNVTAAELAADLTVFGGLAALAQKLLAKSAPAPAPVTHQLAGAKTTKPSGK